MTLQGWKILYTLSKNQFQYNQEGSPKGLFSPETQSEDIQCVKYNPNEQTRISEHEIALENLTLSLPNPQHLPRIW